MQVREIEVRQFKRGWQGFIRQVDTIQRRIHTCKSFAPPFTKHGICGWHVFKWAMYKGAKWALREEQRDGESTTTLVLTLPGDDILEEYMVHMKGAAAK